MSSPRTHGVALGIHRCRAAGSRPAHRPSAAHCTFDKTLSKLDGALAL